MKMYVLLNFFTKFNGGRPPWLLLLSLVTSELLFLAVLYVYLMSPRLTMSLMKAVVPLFGEMQRCSF